MPKKNPYVKSQEQAGDPRSYEEYMGGRSRRGCPVIPFFACVTPSSGK